jgi:hypothetical protein
MFVAVGGAMQVRGCWLLPGHAYLFVLNFSQRQPGLNLTNGFGLECSRAVPLMTMGGQLVAHKQCVNLQPLPPACVSHS